jgi:hypothetical protein
MRVGLRQHPRVDPTNENIIYTLALGVSVRDSGKTFGRIGAPPPGRLRPRASRRRTASGRWWTRRRRRQPRDVDRPEEHEVLLIGNDGGSAFRRRQIPDIAPICRQ